MALAEDLAALPTPLRAELDRAGFSHDQLIAWAQSLAERRDPDQDRLRGRVEPPPPDLLDELPADGPARKALADEGRRALAEGKVAICVLAGGMATRMGGVVKALVEAVDGKTFLDIRLAEQQKLSREAGRAIPLWLMTSPPTDGPIREALANRAAEGVAPFLQCASLRLAEDGTLFRDDAGEPSMYATGHGDLVEALSRSGLARAFLDSGGETMMLANLDNLGATLDPAIVGFHRRHDAPITVEVVDKEPGDKGGGPVVHDGTPIICEEFRLPKGFDASQVPVFNTNTFMFDLERALDPGGAFTFVRVEKQVGDRKAIQFERLVGEITMMLPTRFLRVSRSGAATRFLPVKDHDELARRKNALRALIQDRLG